MRRFRRHIQRRRSRTEIRCTDLGKGATVWVAPFFCGCDEIQPMLLGFFDSADDCERWDRRSVARNVGEEANCAGGVFECETRLSGGAAECSPGLRYAGDAAGCPLLWSWRLRRFRSSGVDLE